jgi:hypothetical protein
MFVWNSRRDRSLTGTISSMKLQTPVVKSSWTENLQKGTSGHEHMTMVVGGMVT